MIKSKTQKYILRIVKKKEFDIVVKSVKKTYYCFYKDINQIFNTNLKFLMKNHFERVKHYLQELNYDITYEDATDEIYIINDESNGIKNLIIDCEDSILMIEQFIFDVQKESLEMFKTLLIKNRQIVHGAFALDETGTKVLFRDTLQLENLDLNELEASINSLKLLLAEHIGELLTLAKQK